jgi:hypothetical protein
MNEGAKPLASQPSRRPSRLWTVKDVAEYAQISERRVYALVAQAKQLRYRGEPGGIPFLQPEGTGILRFKREEVKAFFGDTAPDSEDIERAVQQPAQTDAGAGSDSAEVVAAKVALARQEPQSMSCWGN